MLSVSQSDITFYSDSDHYTDPVNSPIFDGSAYSMSGNGVYEAHNCTEALPTDLNCIPPGQGGGCVETGPFKKWGIYSFVVQISVTNIFLV
jgi:hypothetical protein